MKAHNNALHATRRTRVKSRMCAGRGTKLEE